MDLPDGGDFFDRLAYDLGDGDRKRWIPAPLLEHLGDEFARLGFQDGPMENQEGPQHEAISLPGGKAGEANLCIAATPQENSLISEDDNRLARDGSFKFPISKADEVEPLPQGWLQQSSALALSENCEPSSLNRVIKKSESNISTTKEEILTSQKSYQDLQWSSLDDAFAGSKKEGKLGSFSDLLSELEKPVSETEAAVIGKHNAQAFEQLESISVYGQTWANHPNPNPGWYFDYSTNHWKQNCDPLKDQGDNFSMESSSIQNNGQVSNSNQESSEDWHNSSDLLNFEEQTNWEQLYPGWYFDYQAQQWRQAEGNQPISLQKEAHFQKGDSSTLQAQQLASTLMESNIDQQYPGWYYDYQTQKWQQIPQQGFLNELKSSLPRASENSTIDEPPPFNNASYTTSEYLSQEPAFNQEQHLVSSGTKTVLGQSNNYPNSAQSPPCELRSAVIAVPRNYVEALRSSAGRPPHTLFAFGFGGKVALMNLIDLSTVHTASSGGSGFVGSPTGSPTVVSIQNLGHLVAKKVESRYQNDVAQYFKVLDRQGVSGPVVGNAGMKDILKWVDERMANCELEEPNCTNPETLRMLWGVLKIACQHYGKLRSVGSSSGIDSMVEDGPEVALGKLLVSNKIQKDFMISKAPLQHINSDQQLQAITEEMKNLLVTGKRKQALECAKQGSLWGPALVLALQLGEKYYAETVTLMARQQFASGCPLRTLCLLLAGQTTEVFAIDPSPLSGLSSHPYGGVSSTLTQNIPAGMLNDWQENLAIILANKTKEDEQVMTHLGDCLWKARDEVSGAHICYLIADRNFEAPSGNTRLCLVGTDHFRNPRTFASPNAIQRTELYEFAKVLGNSQFVLLPFQPYKLVYANMLVEAGKVIEALRYCQEISKNLKSAGRAPEVESCRLSTAELEDRLRFLSQGGYGLHLDPKRLVARIVNTIDNTVHKIIGGPPTTALVPSASMEPISTHMNGKGKLDLPPKSVSEPVLNRNNILNASQDKPDLTSSEKNSSPKKCDNNSETHDNSYFNRFGFLAKAVGFIRQSRKEAKLGEKNKFYYDEKLKRWVEEGVEPTPEEVAPPPPPVITKLLPKDGVSNSESLSYLNNEAKDSVGSSEVMNFTLGTPPLPPSVNRFSARSRIQGVRSRYVDTFNKSGSSQTTLAKPFQSPGIPSSGLAVMLKPPASFFIPPALPNPEASFNDGEIQSSGVEESQRKSKRHSSVDDVLCLSEPENSAISTQHMGGDMALNGNVGRAASWNGFLSDSEAMGMASTKNTSNTHHPSQSPSSLLPIGSVYLPANENDPLQGQLFEDMQEVEL